jgi:hypothetical protein
MEGFSSVEAFGLVFEHYITALRWVHALIYTTYKT